MEWQGSRGGRKHESTFANDNAQTPDYESKWHITHPVENVRKDSEAKKREKKATLNGPVT